MSYGRYKRALLLKRVEVTTARMQKVPNHGLRKVEARLEQRSRICRSGVAVCKEHKINY